MQKEMKMNSKSLLHGALVLMLAAVMAGAPISALANSLVTTSLRATMGSIFGNNEWIAPILLLLSAGAVGISAQAAPPKPAAEEEIRQINDEEVQAFLSCDPRAMGRLWSDDLVVTNPLNKLVTKAQVLEMVQSGFLVIRSYQRKVEYLHFYGDMAIVAGSESVVWGGRMPMAGKRQELRFTGVWLNQGGQWREIARHANVVADASQP